MNGHTKALENHVLPCDGPNRRDNIPMIYVRGSYYDVGYDIGKTFTNLIHENINSIHVLNEVYIPLYQTENGKKVYNEAYETVRKYYPQYIKELQGMADGAAVPFYKLFLLHLDDILPNVLERNSTNGGQGCSTVTLNHENQVIIGHNEDAFKEILGNVFIANVRITEVEPNEIFTAFCYAGLLPGYAMGYNVFFAFSINIIGAKEMSNRRIPRTFATRAMLAVNSLVDIEDVLRYRGGGVGDAMAINLALFRHNQDPLMYNIEVSPSNPLSNESAYSIIKIERGEYYFHCNRFLHLNVPEEDGKLLSTSYEREATKETLPVPVDKQDVINIIGDSSQTNYNIFRNECDELVITIAVGIFDFNNKTWSVYTDNPKTHKPIAVIRLYDHHKLD